MGNGLKYYLIKISRHVDDVNSLALTNKNDIPNRTLLVNAHGLKRQKIFMKLLVRVEFYFNWFAVTYLLKSYYKKLKYKV